MDNRGQFFGGNKYQFKQGATNKIPQRFWDKDWLSREYLIKSAAQIAEELQVSVKTIYFWLKKHNIAKNKADQFTIKYWWDNKRLSATFHEDGKEVQRGQLER